MTHAAYHAHIASGSGGRQVRTESGTRSVGVPLDTSDLVITRNGFHVRLAAGVEDLRAKTARLVGDLYGRRGLDTYHDTSLADRPGQTTLVVCCGDRLFGTLTLGIDVGDGLLADALYGDEIESARLEGARVSEVTRLAFDPDFNSNEAMATIFHLCYILASLIHGATDSFIEVHPRHAGYYRRMLGYRIAGEERVCPRVQAPAVLMHLPFKFAERKLQQLAQTNDADDRSLYRLFMAPEEEQRLVARLHGSVPGTKRAGTPSHGELAAAL